MRTEIEIRHAIHEGGTKFYTIIGIRDMGDGEVELAEGKLIKIYGPVDKHGNVTHETFPNHHVLSAGASQMLKKEKRGYKFETLSRGIDYKKGYLKSTIDKLGMNHIDTSYGEVVQKYKVEIINAIRLMYGMDASPVEEGDEDYEVKSKIKSRPPKPEPIRNEDWGSW